MVKITTINILGLPNVILDLKKGYDKTLKNITIVSEDLRITFGGRSLVTKRFGLHSNS